MNRDQEKPPCKKQDDDVVVRVAEEVIALVFDGEQHPEEKEHR